MCLFQFHLLPKFKSFFLLLLYLKIILTNSDFVIIQFCLPPRFMSFFILPYFKVILTQSEFMIILVILTRLSFKILLIFIVVANYIKERKLCLHEKHQNE